jgi:hypothetical protein
VEYWNNGDFRQAYQEAERAVRPLRILMRAQWEQATRGLDAPVSSPYAVSFFTLPRHWQAIEPLLRESAQANVLPDGGFENARSGIPESWTLQQTTLDPISLKARRVQEEPVEGAQCLLLEITPQNPAVVPQALERTFLALRSATVRLQPGTPVRISGWIKIPQPITASPDGALLYDSAGGEPLAIRLTAPTKWKKLTLYRQVPASGTMNVTLALTGIGKVYFDDVRIEPLLPGATALDAHR